MYWAQASPLGGTYASGFRSPLFPCALVLWIFILKRWETFNPTWLAFVLAPEVAAIALALGWWEIATHGFKERFRWPKASGG